MHFTIFPLGLFCILRKRKHTHDAHPIKTPRTHWYYCTDDWNSLETSKSVAHLLFNVLPSNCERLVSVLLLSSDWSYPRIRTTSSARAWGSELIFFECFRKGCVCNSSNEHLKKDTNERGWCRHDWSVPTSIPDELRHTIWQRYGIPSCIVGFWSVRRTHSIDHHWVQSLEEHRDDPLSKDRLTNSLSSVNWVWSRRMGSEPCTFA